MFRTTMLLWILFSSTAFAVEPLQKAAIPTTDAQVGAAKLIKEVYGEELAAVKTPNEKKAVVNKLLRKAAETTGDLSSQYMLLTLSQDLAVQNADVPSMLQAIDEIDKAFQIDALVMKYTALSKLTTVQIAKDLRTLLSQRLGELSEESVSRERFDLAKQFNELALSEARKINDALLTKSAVDHKTEIDEIAKVFEEAKLALVTLDKSPTDFPANFIVGKYKCFIRKDWASGLPMLALSGDPAIQTIAQVELKVAMTPGEQANLGDSWWDVSDSQSGVVKKQVRARAVYWYKQALPSLTGLPKDKAEKRIAEVEADRRTDNKKWVDVTNKIDPKQHTIKGDWEVTKIGIVDRNVPNSHIMVPVLLKSNYGIEIEFTRIEGKGEVCLIIPVGQQHCRVVLSGNNGEESGLARINNKAFNENETTVRPGTLENNRKYTLHISVTLEDGDKQTDIAVNLNGKRYLKYHGPVASLALPANLKAPAKSYAALGTNGSSAIYHSIKVLQDKQ